MKDKMKFIPLNLISSIPQAMLIYLLCSIILNIETTETLYITFTVYFYDVMIFSKFDYLEDKVNYLLKK